MAKGIKQNNATRYQQVNLTASSLINYDFHRIYASWLTAPSNKSQQCTHPCFTYSPTTKTSVPSFLLTARLFIPLPQYPYALSICSSPRQIFCQLCVACWWAKRHQDLCRDQGYMEHSLTGQDTPYWLLNQSVRSPTLFHNRVHKSASGAL